MPITSFVIQRILESNIAHIEHSYLHSQHIIRTIYVDLRDQMIKKTTFRKAESGHNRHSVESVCLLLGTANYSFNGRRCTSLLLQNSQQIQLNTKVANQRSQNRVNGHSKEFNGLFRLSFHFIDCNNDSSFLSRYITDTHQVARYKRIHFTCLSFK